MSTIPPNPDDAILWLTDHLATWGADPAAVGLAEADITEMQAALDAAIAARGQTVALRSQSKSATSDYHTKLKDMRSDTSLRVSKIRTFARGSADPASVYTLAEIPAPATPTEAPAPATPSDFRVSLEESGALRFTFKCSNPARVSGVTYRVERQDTPPQGAFTFVTNAKEKAFVDQSFPNTSTAITYRVTAQTSTKDSAATYFTVRYGAGNQAAILSEGPMIGGQAA
ncbi:MAG: hypothetical protein NCW75_06055 [Phycisphaera sp.]|nr:MAG: hypothetical protein NCW75_06055 [Phycisphaera sp.]